MPDCISINFKIFAQHHCLFKAKKFLAVAALASLLQFFTCNLSSLAQEAKKKYTLPVVTGEVKIFGWQHQVVNRNPNLMHYPWMPMTTVKRSVMTVSPQISTSPIDPSRKQQYVKPIHIPFMPAKQRPTTPPQMRSTKAIYVKPVHIPFDTRSTNAALQAKQSSQSTSGQILPHEDQIVSGDLIKQPEIATYGKLNSSPAVKNTQIRGERKEVTGKVMPSGHH